MWGKCTHSFKIRLGDYHSNTCQFVNSGIVLLCLMHLQTCSSSINRECSSSLRHEKPSPEMMSSVSFHFFHPLTQWTYNLAHCVFTEQKSPKRVVIASNWPNKVKPENVFTCPAICRHIPNRNWCNRSLEARHEPGWKLSVIKMKQIPTPHLWRATWPNRKYCMLSICSLQTNSWTCSLWHGSL